MPDGMGGPGASTDELVFKMADTEAELEQICAMNYATFVEEIPQHEKNDEKRLVDKFHSENDYVIALQDGRVVGMLAGRGVRPFSLDGKLDLAEHIEEGRKLLEIRLLSVDPGKRGTRIAVGLMAEMLRYGIENGYTDALISGTTRQLRLYKKLGFEPFGPLVGNDPDAMFQPMRLKVERLAEKAQQFGHLMDAGLQQAALMYFDQQTSESDDTNKASAITELGAVPTPSAPKARAERNARDEVTLLPGPVNIRQSVREVFKQDPVSHRAEFFVEDFQATKRALTRFVNAKNVEILVGTGTMANDVIGGQLSLLGQTGLMLSNGEFGERLVDHATRFGLDFDVMREDWGTPYSIDKIKAVLDRHPHIGWLWTTHCETSTGVLNPLDELKALCKERDIKLCLDGVSSIAAVPVDLEGVYLCSGSSGKAIGGFPGLSCVFYNHVVEPNKRLPRYLDLGQYAANNGIAYTHSSNLVYALKEAVDSFEDGLAKVQELSDWVRGKVEALGLEIVAPRGQASPAVLSIVIPEWVSSKAVGDAAYDAGYLLSYMSSYLLKRNWVQVCLMGDLPAADIEPLLAILEKMCVPAEKNVA
jgi:aspartate aminotransferase-like enzyme/GNAT superfamily N-acetyltransferase